MLLWKVTNLMWGAAPDLLQAVAPLSGSYSLGFGCNIRDSLKMWCPRCILRMKTTDPEVLWCSWWTVCKKSVSAALEEDKKQSPTRGHSQVFSDESDLLVWLACRQLVSIFQYILYSKVFLGIFFKHMQFFRWIYFAFVGAIRTGDWHLCSS